MNDLRPDRFNENMTGEQVARNVEKLVGNDPNGITDNQRTQGLIMPNQRINQLTASIERAKLEGNLENAALLNVKKTNWEKIRDGIQNTPRREGGRRRTRRSKSSSFRRRKSGTYKARV